MLRENVIGIESLESTGIPVFALMTRSLSTVCRQKHYILTLPVLDVIFTANIVVRVSQPY